MNTTIVKPLIPTTFGKDFVYNPYPVYEQLLNEGRIFLIEGKINTWILPQYDDILALFKTKNLSSARSLFLTESFSEEEKKEVSEFMRLISMWLVFEDGATHIRLRRFLNKGISTFLSKNVIDHIKLIVSKLIDNLKGKKEANLVGEFAQRIPAIVMIHSLGVPEKDYEKFMLWAEEITNFYGTAMKPRIEDGRIAQIALVSMTNYFKEMIEERRIAPKDDLISFMIAQNKEEEILTDDELLALIANLLFAGYETTGHLIGNGIYTLLKNPDEKMKILKDPSLMPSAFEEILRYESAAQVLGRVAACDFEIYDQVIKKGEKILLLIGAANTDASKFEDPRKFIIERKFEFRPLSFGAGSHQCPGADPSRIEVIEAIEQLFRAFPNMKLKDSEPNWRTSNPAFRGLKELNVLLS